jgi:uncharacterized membrane protein YqaE (UPF0057 family)
MSSSSSPASLFAAARVGPIAAVPLRHKLRELRNATVLQSNLCSHSCSDIIKIIFAIVLPPLGVFLERGCGGDFLINILLTILGYIPGIIHALFVPLLS